MSLGHILNPTGYNGNAERPDQALDRNNTENRQNAESFSNTVRSTIEIDKATDHISEGDDDSNDTGYISDASSVVQPDTQTTVCSIQEDHKISKTQLCERLPLAPSLEDSIEPYPGYPGKDIVYRGKASKKSEATCEHPTKRGQPRKALAHGLDEDEENIGSENSRDGDDNTKFHGHARRRGYDSLPKALKAHHPSRPRLHVSPNRRPEVPRLAKKNEDEKHNDDKSSAAYAWNRKSRRSPPPGLQHSSRYTESDPHWQHSKFRIEDPVSFTAQSVSDSQPASSRDNDSRSNKMGAAVQNLTLHPSNSLDWNRNRTKRQRNSPTPEPGEEAGPSPPKSVRLNHRSPGNTDHDLLRIPMRSRRSSENIPSSDTRQEASDQNLVLRGIPPAPEALSPSKPNIYNRRQSTSPTRIPTLATPGRRNQRVYRASSPQPPSPETNSQSFNVFIALLAHPELMLEVSKHLEVDNLVNLYAISKDYHALIDNRFTTLITSQATSRASESAQTFPFRAYRNLCKRDPAGRIMLFNISAREGLERVATPHDNDVRFVPSFRWLKMILHRDSTVDRILRCLAQEGHRLPKRTSLVLKKLWFTLDITDNGRRIGVLHDARFWSNKDLFLATMFFVKLDMRLTDPTTGDGEMGLRKMLLAQRSLSTLAAVLARTEMRSQLEMLRMLVRWDYTPPRALHKGETVFGVPAGEVGRGCYEGGGKGERKLVGIEELVGREAVRRRLGLQDHYIDMMLYGFVNKRTWEDVRTPMNLLGGGGGGGDGGGEDDWMDISGENTEEEEQEEEEEEEEDDDDEWRIESQRRERMGLFGSEADEEGDEEENEQEQESSMDG